MPMPSSHGEDHEHAGPRRRQLARFGKTRSSVSLRAYHDLSWQAFFDVFNSLPLLALGVPVARRLARPHAAVLFLSMMLHAVCDFALHRKDAHRHFFPFSDWRFQSPVSYWDPRHYGGIVTTIEMVVVVAGAVVLFKQYRNARKKT